LHVKNKTKTQILYNVIYLLYTYSSLPGVNKQFWMSMTLTGSIA